MIFLVLCTHVDLELSASGPCLLSYQRISFFLSVGVIPKDLSSLILLIFC